MCGQRSAPGIIPQKPFNLFLRTGFLIVQSYQVGWAGCPVCPKDLPLSEYQALRLQVHVVAPGCCVKFGSSLYY